MTWTCSNYYHQLQATLANETTNTQSKQIELDRLAEEFREMHSSRQELVQRWQDAIEAMHRRDNEINKIAEQYAIAKQKRAVRRPSLERCCAFLAAQNNEREDAPTCPPSL